MQNKIAEKDIQKFILDYLLASKKGHFWRNNTVGVFDPTRKQFRKNAGQEKGIADILGVCKGRFVAIECKASNVKKLREDQEIFKNNIEACGGIFYLANDIDNFIAWFKAGVAQW